MPETGIVKIHGREFRSLVVTVRRRLVKAHGKLYPHYSVTLPKPLGDWLLEHEKRYAEKLSEPLRSDLLEEEPDKLEALILVGPSDWYHGLLWETLPHKTWIKLAPQIRGELEALGLDPGGEETILIPAKKSELEALGLDTSKPITLEDLKKALEKKAAKPTVAPA